MLYRPILILAALAALAGPTLAAAPTGGMADPKPTGGMAEPKATGGAGVLTRFFKDIESLENQVEQSLASGDKDAQSRLLSPIFVMQQPNRPLLARDGLPGVKASLGHIKLLQVHEAGGVLVAVLSSESHRDALITDIWQSVDGTHWQLRLRVVPSARR